MEDKSKSFTAMKSAARHTEMPFILRKIYQKYGDDTGTKYPVRLRKNAVLGDTLGIVDVRVAKKHSTAGEKSNDTV